MVAGVPPPVAHPPYVLPRLLRHQLSRLITEPSCRLADAFQAPLHGIVTHLVTSPKLPFARDVEG